MYQIHHTYFRGSRIALRTISDNLNSLVEVFETMGVEDVAPEEDEQLGYWRQRGAWDHDHGVAYRDNPAVRGLSLSALAWADGWHDAEQAKTATKAEVYESHLADEIEATESRVDDLQGDRDGDL